MARKRLIRVATVLLFVLALIVAFSTYYLDADAQAGDANVSAPYTSWKEYGGSPDDAQYSALKQINRSNVSELKQAWFYPAGNNGFRFGMNPIIIDGVMYVAGKDNSVVALDAATGKELWAHPIVKGSSFSH